MATHLIVRSLAALLLNGVVFTMIALAAATLVRDRAAESRWPISAVTVALAGYGVFWCGFFYPLAGNIAAWAVLGAATMIVGWRWKDALACLRLAGPTALGTALFSFGAVALLLFYPGASISATARERFLPGMPGDNEIPGIFTEIISSGNPTRVIGGDWLTSDRPPLQTCVALLGWPLLSALGFNLEMACATAGIWFQALWFPAVALLLRALGLSPRAALGVTAAVPGTGFLMFNTVFVWPKLGAAAFTITAFVLWLAPKKQDPEINEPGRLALGAACVACGWLAHGGVMFSLAPLALLTAAATGLRIRLRSWLPAVALLVLLAAPWLAYQHWYAPPGNRLVKWHIAGVIPPDARSVSAALRDSYREIGWRGAWNARTQNFHMLFNGDWTSSFNPWATTRTRRESDVAYPLRTDAAWTLGLIALPWLVFRRDRVLRERASFHLLTAAWLVGGLVLWLALMFFPNAVFTHQGSYVTQLLLLTLLAAWAWMAGPVFFAIVAVVQWLGFFATWSGAGSVQSAPMDQLAVFVAITCWAALAALSIWTLTSERKARHAGKASRV